MFALAVNALKSQWLQGCLEPRSRSHRRPSCSLGAVTRHEGPSSSRAESAVHWTIAARHSRGRAPPSSIRPCGAASREELAGRIGRRPIGEGGAGCDRNSAYSYAGQCGARTRCAAPQAPALELRSNGVRQSCAGAHRALRRPRRTASDRLCAQSRARPDGAIQDSGSVIVFDATDHSFKALSAGGSSGRRLSTGSPLWGSN
jgi:hypothetical protein